MPLLALGLAACSPTPPPPAPAPAAPKATVASAAATAPAAKTVPAAATSPGKDGARPPGSGPGSGARRSSEAERERQRQTAAEMVPVETALVRRGPISAFLTFNTTLETEAMVGAGSLVTPNNRVPTHTLAMGRPARVVRPLTDAEKEHLLLSAQGYVEVSARFLAGECTPCEPLRS